LVVAVDANKHLSGRPTVSLGVRGGLWVDVTVDTSTRELPLSLERLVPNAAVKAVEIIGSLVTEEAGANIDGFYDQVLPPTEQENEWLEKLRVDESAISELVGFREPYGAEEKLDIYRDMAFFPSLNVTGFMSGYSGKGAKCSIPNSATIKIVIMLVPNQDPDRILKQLKKHILGINREAQVKTILKVPPSRTDAELRSVKWFMTAFERIAGTEPLVIPSWGGLGPQWVFLDVIETPLVWLPLAQPDCNAHSANENLSIAAFREGVQVIAALLTTPGLEEG
jgi:acetylornithine deacetylase/succinyl-diaminopimelate desuccinylase-like protein